MLIVNALCGHGPMAIAGPSPLNLHLTYNAVMWEVYNFTLASDLSIIASGASPL